MILLLAVRVTVKVLGSMGRKRDCHHKSRVLDGPLLGNVRQAFCVATRVAQGRSSLLSRCHTLVSWCHLCAFVRAVAVIFVEIQKTAEACCCCCCWSVLGSKAWLELMHEAVLSVQMMLHQMGRRREPKVAIYRRVEWFCWISSSTLYSNKYDLS